MHQLRPGEVAALMGLNHQTLRRVLSGDRDVTVHELLRLGEVVSVPSAVLVQRALDRAAEEKTGL